MKRKWVGNESGSPGVQNSRGEGEHGKSAKPMSGRIGGGNAYISNREVFSRLQRFLAPRDEPEMGRNESGSPGVRTSWGEGKHGKGQDGD